MEEPDTATESSGTPSTIEKSPLDFDNENPSPQITESDGPEDQVQETVAPKILPPRNVSATGAAPKGNDGAEANAPPKVLKKDHATSRPTQSILGGKSLASMGVEPVSTSSAVAPQETPFDGAAVAGDPDSEKSSSFTPLVGSPGSIYQPGWGVTNNCRLDTSDA
ncbi:hypothetical protein Tco_1366512, partial [Tanacetum coccineum]